MVATNKWNLYSIALSALASIGTAATAIMAVKATPKAYEKIQQDSAKNHYGDKNAFTKEEAIRSGWKYYIPAGVTFLATVGCIVGSNITGKKSKASLIGAYKIISDRYRDYRRKNIELNGKEADDEILKSLRAEKSTLPPITFESCWSISSMDFENAGEDKKLFYDSFSERYFEATISQVLLAEYSVNRNYALGAIITLNDFYDFLGISNTKNGDISGWYCDGDLYWIDFYHEYVRIDDTLDCWCIYASNPLMDVTD